MIQQRLDLRPPGGDRLEHGATRVRRCAVQRKPRTLTAVGPALVRAKEERPSGRYWPTESAAQLVFHAIGGMVETRGDVEIAPGIEAVVVVEPEPGAAEIVGPAFRDDVHHRPCRA